MLQLHPDGTGITVTLGTDIAAEMQPQVIVPMNTWQGARLKPGGNFALLGNTVSPGFDYSDYEDGKREELSSLYPRFRSLIVNLTRE
jgi:predicted cupin superfamily sugar epimerase